MSFRPHSLKVSDDITEDESAKRAAKKAHVETKTTHETFRTPRVVLKEMDDQFGHLIFRDRPIKTCIDPAGGDGRYLWFLKRRKIIPSLKGSFIIDIDKSERPKWEKKKLVDRLGKDNCVIADFFNVKSLPHKFDLAMTNPPFTMSQAFVAKMLKCVKQDGKVILFEKLSFLGGQERAKWLAQAPLKYVVVITYRVKLEIDDTPAYSPAYEHAFYVFDKTLPKNTPPQVLFLQKDPKYHPNTKKDR